jgi:hypothetical protein
VSELFRIVFTLYLLSQGSAVVGALVLWMAAHSGDSQPVELADAFDGYDPDENTVKIPERVVAHRPMSALERLEGPTRRIIRTPDGYEVRPYWYGGRHREPESRCRIPRFLDAPQATAEFPPIEVGRHPSGEYPVLDGVR